LKRRDLEHVIRAAAGIADDPEIIVIGSQAVLGSIPDAPVSLLVSVEADVIPKNRPERAADRSCVRDVGSSLNPRARYALPFRGTFLPRGTCLVQPRDEG